MKKTLLLALVLIACEKEGLFSQQDASGARRGPTVAFDASPSRDLTPDKESPSSLDTRPDLPRDLVVDLSKTDLQPDTTPLSIGTKCLKPADCQSGFCTDGVCCAVEKCIDTCVPGSSYACAPYTGFTCSPLGTCRGF